MKFVIMFFVLTILNAFNLYAEDKLSDKKFINKNKTIYFYISDNYTIAGFSGCNNFNGRIIGNKKKATMSIVGVSSTRKYCDNDAIQRAERDFYYKLSNVSSYTFKKGTLNLLDKNYKILASFYAQG